MNRKRLYIFVFFIFLLMSTIFDIQEQELKPFERKGYTLIEWGGAELN